MSFFHFLKFHESRKILILNTAYVITAFYFVLSFILGIYKITLKMCDSFYFTEILHENLLDLTENLFKLFMPKNIL